MDRREMLFGVMAAAGLSWAGGEKAPSAGGPFVLREGETLSDTVLNSGGNVMHLLLRGSDTGGSCSVLDNITSPGGGPPLHVHEHEDEWFHVQAGEYAIQVGKEVYHLKPGESAFGPRGVPHAFECISAQAGKLLTVFGPGGVEGFFIDLTKLGHPTPELVARYGMKVVGPKLNEAVVHQSR